MPKWDSWRAIFTQTSSTNWTSTWKPRVPSSSSAKSQLIKWKGYSRWYRRWRILDYPRKGLQIRHLKTKRTCRRGRFCYRSYPTIYPLRDTRMCWILWPSWRKSTSPEPSESITLSGLLHFVQPSIRSKTSARTPKSWRAAGRSMRRIS